MNTTALHWLRPSLIIIIAASAALLTGCADDGPAGPHRQVELPTVSAQVGPDLAGCDSLQAPEGSKVVYHAYAKGVQMYRWDGSRWVFEGPSAQLYADPDGKKLVGTHYLSPTGPAWERLNGGKVVGQFLKGCTPNPDAIAWLLLQAVSADGPGPLQGVTHIQRVTTVGGKAPSESGTWPGRTEDVPYTAEYYFYRAP